MPAYQIGSPDFLNDICLVGLRVDGTVIGNCVDFLAVSTNLGHSVFFCLLELVDDIFQDIDKYYLEVVLEDDEHSIWDFAPRSQRDIAFQPRSHAQCSHYRNARLSCPWLPLVKNFR